MYYTSTGGGASSTVQYIHTDHLAGSSVITNADGEVIQALDYYPYGDLRINDQYTEFDEQRKFTGHEYDAETGLSYMGARYYNPGVARFLSQDPAFQNLDRLGTQLTDPQSWNCYAYASNNPLRYNDPNGEFWKEFWSFSQGAGNSLVSNNAFGLGRQSRSDSYFSAGQTAGDVISLIQGSFETAAGIVTAAGGAAGGVILSPTGVGALAGAGVSAGGLAIAGHGYGTALTATTNLFQGSGRDSYFGPKAGDKIGDSIVTKHAADQAKLRNVSNSQIQKALDKGMRYYDTKNNSDIWIIGERGKGGYSVVTTPDRQRIKTVQNFVPNLSTQNGKRFIKY